MRFLLIFSILAAFLGGCSSYEREQQREEQQVDTFDSPVGGQGVYQSPYENQPR